ncbi:MAG TPA: biotin/lipoyl-containing protein [Kofleriaceae bacterium]|nr:biotin/lipoyl-containing protein [Kofleriaceae bacterium]
MSHVLGGRIHAAKLRVVEARDGAKIELRAPMPGHFIPAIDDGDLVTPEEVIGQLVVLGRSVALVAGEVRGLAVAAGRPRAVAYGDVLCTLDLEATLGAIAGATDDPAAAAASHELVFRAPTSGRFYGRPGPDKPAFASAGSELAPNATVCLLEVMKTFHRVTYGGAGLPERARVRAVLVADGDDVNAGDPLLALEPIA